MLKIGGETTQIGTGKIVTYQVEYGRTDQALVWNGRVLLLGGKWHQLDGGQILGVSDGQEAPTVIQHLAAAIELLDFAKLNTG